MVVVVVVVVVVVLSGFVVVELSERGEPNGSLLRRCYLLHQLEGDSMSWLS